MALLWSRLHSFVRREFINCFVRPISKSVVLVSPLFFGRRGLSLCWRFDREWRLSGINYVPLFGVGSVIVVADR